MALKMYHDSAGNQEITSANPDGASGAVQAGTTFTDIKQVFVKGQAGRTYKNVSLTARQIPSGMTMQYSTAAVGPWDYEVDFADGDFSTAVGVYRRIQRLDVSDPFKAPDAEAEPPIPAIEHELTFDEYIGQ